MSESNSSIPQSARLHVATQVLASLAAVGMPPIKASGLAVAYADALLQVLPPFPPCPLVPVELPNDQAIDGMPFGERVNLVHDLMDRRGITVDELRIGLN